MEDPYSFYKYGPGWPTLRSRALQRDKNTCQICGKVGQRTEYKTTDMEVHHLKNPESREIRHERLDNLITLCSHCHRRFSYTAWLWEDYFVAKLNQKILLYLMDAYFR